MLLDFYAVAGKAKKPVVFIVFRRAATRRISGLRRDLQDKRSDLDTELQENKNKLHTLETKQATLQKGGASEPDRYCGIE